MERLNRLLSRQVLVRVAADVVLINVALIIAVILSLASFSVQAVEARMTWVDQMFAGQYARNALMLTAVSVSVFAISGFYSHSRAYRSRYKALVVFQGVTGSFLVFGCVSYLTAGYYGFGRSAMLFAWWLTLVLVGGARLWSALWKYIVATDSTAAIESTAAKRTGPLAARTVLVIGGAGYIGSALLPKLLDAGCRVRILDLLMYGIQPIAQWRSDSRVELIKADFRHVDRVVEAVRGVDSVVHLGGIVGDPACAVDEELSIDVNLMATRMIAEVVKGSGIHRFVFASTCSVYGASDEILDERSRLHPVSLYAKSKIASERVLQSLAGENFRPTILRFSTIFGLSGRIRFDLVVNLLTAKAANDGKITVFGGDQWRPFLHVEDAASAILRVLQMPSAAVCNQIFNVGGNALNHTISDVAMMIHKKVPAAELIDMGSDSDRRNYRVNFDRIHRLLGYEPRWTVNHGIDQVLHVLRNGQVEHYTDSQFSNVKYLVEERGSRLPKSESQWAYRLIAEIPAFSQEQAPAPQVS